MKPSRRLGLTRASRGSRIGPFIYNGMKGWMLVDTAIELMVVDFRTSVVPSERRACEKISNARGQDEGMTAASRKLSMALSTVTIQTVLRLLIQLQPFRRFV